MYSADVVLAEVTDWLRGSPVFVAGSLVAADEHGLPFAYEDADVFCPSGEVLIATAQKLLGHGLVLDERHSRVWARWLKYGFKTWHTNSLKLMSPAGYEVNLVFKRHNNVPTTSLAQVLESFDFGLLGVGYDLCDGVQRRDLRDYLFPDHPVNGALPLMPNKRSDWRNGFISQYNGTREAGRYAKYFRYGYDLSLVKEDLLIGYGAATEYLRTRTDSRDKQVLGDIYEKIAELIASDQITELYEAGKEIVYLDSLDAIMEALE